MTWGPRNGPQAPRRSARPGAAVARLWGRYADKHLAVPLHEPVGVLLQRGVVADLSHRAGGMLGAVLRGAAGTRARLLSRLDAGVVADPAHARLPGHAPEPVIDRLQGAHEDRAGGNRTRAERPHGEAAPPDVGLGERANGRAGEAA